MIVVKTHDLTMKTLQTPVARVTQVTARKRSNVPPSNRGVASQFAVVMIYFAAGNYDKAGMTRDTASFMTYVSMLLKHIWHIILSYLLEVCFSNGRGAARRYAGGYGAMTLIPDERVV